MEELTAVARVFSDFTPGTVGIWTGVVMFAGYLLREFRETRKLSAEDRLARREGYAKQVENLQSENRELRREVDAARDVAVEARREHDEYRRLCHAETDQLRQDIIKLENTVAGLQRQLASAGAAAARQFGKTLLGFDAQDRDPEE